MNNKETNLISLLENAANTASEGITISSMSIEDRPLVYLNAGFERLTGYSQEDAMGKNCRFLQGADTEQEPINELRTAISNGEACTVELLNYKKDGTPFWNRLSIAPIKNEDDVVTHYVGVQSDITELKETKQRLLDANEKLELFHKNITYELEQANRVQQFILPAGFPENKWVKFDAKFMPMDQIGGDFYDITELDKGIYGLLIADVTGHGIPAALLTFMASFAFKNSALRISSPAKVVSITNNKLHNQMPRGAFVTMFYAIYDADTMRLTFTQAGHPEGYIVRPATKEVIPLCSEGSLVGAFPAETVSFGEETVQLAVGDKLLLYTDAILESRNENEEMMDLEYFRNFLLKNRDLSISDLLDEISTFGTEFSSDGRFDDDFILVGFEVLPK
jgi:PAS domain S-box-containing protein